MGRKVCCLCLWCVSVESAMECRIRNHDVFCAVSMSGAMWSAMSVPLGNRFGRLRKPLSLRTQAVPVFSNIQRLPVHVL